MNELLTVLRIVNTTATALQAGLAALEKAKAIMQPAIDQGRQLTPEERAQVEQLVDDQYATTRATLEGIASQG